MCKRNGDIFYTQNQGDDSMEETTIKYLYHDEKEALFNIIDQDRSLHYIRNKAMFFLAEYAALRASEIGLIRLDEFNIHNKEIYLHRLKGSNNNTLRIIDTRVYDALTDYLDYRTEHNIQTDFLFCSQKQTPVSRKTLDKLMKRYCARANIPSEKAHFHVLKHTRAVELAELGLDTKEVQYWLGHKSIKNTEIYLQFTSRQQEALYRKIQFLKNTDSSATHYTDIFLQMIRR